MLLALSDYVSKKGGLAAETKKVAEKKNPDTGKARLAPFYDELQDQGLYLPAYAPQSSDYNHGYQAQQVGQLQVAEYAMVFPLFLLICFLFMAVACVATICCGSAGYVFGQRSGPQNESMKVRA